MSSLPSWNPLIPELDAAPTPTDHNDCGSEAFSSVRRSSAEDPHLVDLPLYAILKQVLGTMRASGAAIALRAGDAVFCRASSGAAAPSVGARLYPGVGLTGLCLNSGESQLCKDTRADSRVNSEACKELGVRSALAVPIKQNSAVAGVLVVLSDDVNAFKEHQVRVIKALANRVLPKTPESTITKHHPQLIFQPLLDRRFSPLLDLTKFFEAAYVLQQQNIRLQLEDLDKKPGPKAGCPEVYLQARHEDEAGLAPQFGQECPISALWSRTSLYAALVLFAMWACGYCLSRSIPASPDVGAVQFRSTDRPSKAAKPPERPLDTQQPVKSSR